MFGTNKFVTNMFVSISVRSPPRPWSRPWSWSPGGEAGPGVPYARSRWTLQNMAMIGGLLFAVLDQPQARP
jgi:hypothetical protein